MILKYKARFKQAFRNLPASQQGRVRETVEQIDRLFTTREAPEGLGLKKLFSEASLGAVCEARVTLELVSTPPAAALGPAASRARREERSPARSASQSDACGASDEQRRAAPGIGPAPCLSMGCGGSGPAAASLLLGVPQGVHRRRRSWQLARWRSQRGSREVLKPTLELRILFSVQQSVVTFLMVGNHEDVRRVIRSFP